MPELMISIATYRRPRLLGELLRSIEQSDPPAGTRVCIVDNDPDGSAATVASQTTLPATYVREPEPGIAAARNRGLAELRATDDFIVFVDDDERVSQGWLQRLLKTQSAHHADVVSGPVISVFRSGTPAWILRGGFIQRARASTGDPMPLAATNNTLLRLGFWRSVGEPTFNTAFSMTGGSDVEFFDRLRRLGARLVWCDEAVVHEDVPLDRATFSWIWRRGVRVGNVAGRLRMRHDSRSRVVVAGAARIGYGVGRQLLSLLAGRGLDARSVAHVTAGVGFIGAGTGRLVVEYARPAPTDSTQRPPG